MSFSFSSFASTRSIFVAAFLSISVGFCGCKPTAPDLPNPNADEIADAESNAAELEFPKFSIEIRNLSADELAKLGPKNEAPTEFLFPNAHYVQVIRPDRLRNLEKGADALEYFEASTLNALPVENLFANADLVLLSKTFSLETLKDAKGAVLQEGFPTPAESIFVRSTEPLDQEAIAAAIFGILDATQAAKVKTQTYGGKEVRVFENAFVVPLDQSGQNLGKIDRILAGFYFPTPNSVVFLSGSPSAFESYFSEKPGDERGIASQRAGRLPLDKLELAFLYDYDFDVATTRLVPFPFPASTPELSTAIEQYVKSFQFVVDATNPEGDFLTLTVDAKSEEGANELKKTIGGALLQIVDNLKQGAEQQPAAAKQIADFTDVLKSVNLNVIGSQVVGSMKNSPETLGFFAKQCKNLNDFRKNSEKFAKYNGIKEALFEFGQLFNSYLAQNKTYPAPICAADGTPLLSWRVAVLPILGAQGQALYSEFKLDEPWNSDANVKLLEKMPVVFANPSDPSMKTKTQFLVFNSANTPFGRAPQGLRLQDVADPTRTLSVVFASPNNAVEWTRPETFVFNPEKPSESFGDFACGVTLMGQVLQEQCDDSEQVSKILATLVYGLEEETPGVENPALGAAPVETPVENSASEAAPVETPVENPTSEAAPVETPVENPTSEAAPVETPVENPTSEAAPVETPVENPTSEVAPVETPVENPTSEAAPVETPAENSASEAAPIE